MLFAKVRLIFSLGSSVLPGTLFLVLFLFQVVIFERLPHPMRGGARQFVSPFFCFFLLRRVFFVFVCALFRISIIYFTECVCRDCRIQYDDMTLHFPLLLLYAVQQYCIPGTRRRNISVCSFVTPELVSL